MSKQLGCFGSILYQDPKSRRCGACSQLAACTVAVADNQIKLEAYFKSLQDEEQSEQSPATKRIIRKIVRKQETNEETPAATSRPAKQITGIEKLPKKARELVQRWLDAEVDFSVIGKGENPFNQTKNDFAKIAMDILMTHPIIGQGAFCDELQKRTGWKLESAVSHLGQIKAMFPFLGLMTVTIEDGIPYFRLKV